MSEIYIYRIPAEQATSEQIAMSNRGAFDFFNVSESDKNITRNIIHTKKLTQLVEVAIKVESSMLYWGNEFNSLFKDVGEKFDEGDLLVFTKAFRSFFVYRVSSSDASYDDLVHFFEDNDQYALISYNCENQPIDTSKISKNYRQYITAIKSKPFILLAGISGTGKSRIVRELARACWDVDSDEYKSHKPKNFEMVQVKPNWHDSSELLGYVSRIGADSEGNGVTFVAGDFLKFMAKAWGDLDKPHFLCLDEMNLAPVEQYFAEYLSVIESRKNCNGIVATDPILSSNKEKWYVDLVNSLTNNNEVKTQFLEHGISIPPNFIVVGTVNMDETTFSFSRKVLDRAMTIEMNEVDLEAGLEDRNETIGILGAAELIGTAVEGVDVYKNHKETCDVVISYLKAVNTVLDRTAFKIAYRTRNEFLLYIVNNLPYSKDANNTSFMVAQALDEITSMKILSRIEGDETKISREFLKNLSDSIKVGLDNVCSNFEAVENSISLKKLDEMMKQLDFGYISFWS